MVGELGNSREGDVAFGTIPFTPMVSYFMVKPLMAALEQAIWFRTSLECTNIRPEILKNMPPNACPNDKLKLAMPTATPEGGRH